MDPYDLSGAGLSSVFAPSSPAPFTTTTDPSEEEQAVSAASRFSIPQGSGIAGRREGMSSLSLVLEVEDAIEVGKKIFSMVELVPELSVGKGNAGLEL